MARRTKKTASRGSVNNIILESLLSGDKYGYEIIKEVEDKTMGKVKLKQPSLYSSLKRFETKNLIESYWGDSDIGGRRHYYRITEDGKAYYKKKTTNRFDEPFEREDEDVLADDVMESDDTPYEVDHAEEDVAYNNKYTFSVEDKMRSLLGEEEQSQEEVKEEIQPQEELPEFEIEQPSHDDKELIDEMYEAIDEQNEITNAPEGYEQVEQVDDNYIPDHVFYSPAPLADQPEEVEQPKQENYAEVNAEQNIQTKKSYEVITDEFGITKLKNSDVQHEHTDRIVDNVNERIAFTDYVAQKPKQKLFETTNNTNTEKEVNYKDVLGELFVNDTQTTSPKSNEAVQSNLLNEEYEQHVEQTNSSSMEKYTKQAENDGFTIKVYKQSGEPTYKNEYLLINKLRFVFGIIMGLLMIMQTTAVLIAISAYGLLFSDQNWIYMCGYFLAIAFAGVYMIPMLISPKAQRSKSIKFNYSMLFALLAFFVSIILIYAFNTFAGLDFSNITHYLSTIILPAVLASNFVVGTIIYYLLTKNKSFY